MLPSGAIVSEKKSPRYDFFTNIDKSAYQIPFIQS